MLNEFDDDNQYNPIQAPIKEIEEKRELLPPGGDEFVKGDNNDDNEQDDTDINGGKHRQMNTMEAIQSAVDASLDAIGSSEVKSLDAEQKKQLITFMDFVDAEPDVSIKYLKQTAWDIQMAMDNYLREHPDHVK